MEAMLQVENSLRRSEAEFFEDRWEHHGAEAERICCDDDERELPGESASDETVIEAGMRDGRRILAANRVIEELQRSDNQDSPDGGDPENDLGEFHAHLGGERCELCVLCGEHQDTTTAATEEHWTIVCAPGIVFYDAPWIREAAASELQDEKRSLRLRGGPFDCAQGQLRPSYTSYSPPTIRPSIRIVGLATDPRNSRSFAISEMLKKRSFRFPATVISSTGCVSSPFWIQIPEAPRE